MRWLKFFCLLIKKFRKNAKMLNFPLINIFLRKFQSQYMDSNLNICTIGLKCTLFILQNVLVARNIAGYLKAFIRICTENTLYQKFETNIHRNFAASFYINVETGNEAVQFYFREYKNRILFAVFILPKI